MMAKAWHILVLVCATINAAWVGWAWHSGEAAWWFVWTSSIIFSVDVALIALRDLLVDA